MNWKITLGCLLLSLALHALLLLVVDGSPRQVQGLQRFLRVDRLPVARPDGPSVPGTQPHRRSAAPASTTASMPTPPKPSTVTSPAAEAPALEPQPVTAPEPLPAAAPAGQRDFTSEPVISPSTPATTSVSGEAAPATEAETVPAGDSATSNLDELYQPPTYQMTPKPAYPRLAERRRWEGTVLLKVVIDATGKVDRAGIDRSSGYEVLDQAALQQIQNWRFHPARRGGRVVEGEVLVPIEFILDRI